MRRLTEVEEEEIATLGEGEKEMRKMTIRRG